MSAPGRPSSFPDRDAVRLIRGDSEYPAALNDLQEFAPPHLFARGRLEMLDVKPAVAIVGTRRASDYGRRVARELSSAFARAGACVVSGLASGIDGIAHRAALDAGGATIAVLGTGLGLVYPRAHRELQAQIARDGLLLTELEPGYPGMKHTFRHRNRIIAAIASLTIVVEAPDRSGALTTAEAAAELDRCVAAVPGPIDQPQYVGSNRLIATGATIIPSVEDALALAGLVPPLRTPQVDPATDEGRVWAALAEGPLDMDALCHRSGLPAARCLVAVSRLEVAGSIECAMTGLVRRR